MTKTQFINEMIKTDLERILIENKTPLTVKQITDIYNCNYFEEMTLQKTSALLQQLIIEGKVYRININNKAYFSNEELKLKKVSTDEPLTIYEIYVRLIKFIKKMKNYFFVPLD